MSVSHHRRIVLSCVVAAVYLSRTEAAPGTGTGRELTPAARLAAIRRAAVWTKTDVPAMDMKAGPQGTFAFAPEQTVVCDFFNRPDGIGSTLKFGCALSPTEHLKVRYGDQNGEVYAQVAATRLLWALGFGANRMYPVKILCRGCISNPWKQVKAKSSSTMFDPATVDVKANGRTLEVTPNEGWAWKELDLVDEGAGGAPAAQRDALKLLAVLVQHGSNKQPNQRILCVDEPVDGELVASGGPTCAHPLMMLTDVGKTFGRANAFDRDRVGAVNFKEWSRMPVWQDSRSGCVGNLQKPWTGTLGHPRIGEPGRLFLSSLLEQLTDSQLHDLFTVARFSRRDPSVTVDDWVRAFKQKRAEVGSRRCPQ